MLMHSVSHVCTLIPLLVCSSITASNTITTAICCSLLLHAAKLKRLRHCRRPLHSCTFCTAPLLKAVVHYAAEQLCLAHSSICSLLLPGISGLLLRLTAVSTECAGLCSLCRRAVAAECESVSISIRRTPAHTVEKDVVHGQLSQSMQIHNSQ
jgi:hypothetical protein